MGGKAPKKQVVHKNSMLGGFSVILVAVFVAQILFCICMFIWCKRVIHEGEEDLVNEQARNYVMLLNFHK